MAVGIDADREARTDYLDVGRCDPAAENLHLDWPILEPTSRRHATKAGDQVHSLQSTNSLGFCCVVGLSYSLRIFALRH